jgi:hypothetical protein
MQVIDLTLRHTLRIGWAWFWRAGLYCSIATSALYFLAYRLYVAWDARLQEPTTSWFVSNEFILIGIVEILVIFAIHIAVLRVVLQKDYSRFRIAIIGTDRKSIPRVEPRM